MLYVAAAVAALGVTLTVLGLGYMALTAVLK